MAKRGSKKALSQEHEEWVAFMYDGHPSASSGAAVTDAGDVRTSDELWECKYKGSPAEPLKSKPTLVRQMEKIADEAYELGREPALALRFWLPASPLAGPDGFINLSVRLTADDAERVAELRKLRGQICEDDGQRWR